MNVDYEAIGQKMVAAMNAQDLQRFLIVCALVSDLYCPGFNPSQSLAKDSNLAKTATRYRVDSPKLASEVRAEFAGKRNEKTLRKKR